MTDMSVAGETGRASRRARTLPPQSEPQRGPEHDRLSAFAGYWSVEGQNHEPEAPYVADERYEWLPGGFFLIYRFNARVGDIDHKRRGYLGYDADKRVYWSHVIDNLGYVRTFEVTFNDRTCTFSGDRERATMIFSEDGQRRTIRWEQSSDGLDWRPLCDVTSVRTRGLSALN